MSSFSIENKGNIESDITFFQQPTGQKEALSKGGDNRIQVTLPSEESKNNLVRANSHFSIDDSDDEEEPKTPTCKITKASSRENFVPPPLRRSGPADRKNSSEFSIQESGSFSKDKNHEPNDERPPEFQLRRFDAMRKLNVEKASRFTNLFFRRQPSEESNVKYSKERVTIPGDPFTGDPGVEIPKQGHYEADGILLEELGEELKSAMIDGVTKEDGEAGKRQFKKDLLRTTKFIIQDGDDVRDLVKPLKKGNIKEDSEEYDTYVNDTIQQLDTFIGDPHLAKVIIGVANQTLNTNNALVCSGAHRPSQGERPADGSVKSFTTTGVIGFSSPSRSKVDGSAQDRTIKLEKVKGPLGQFFILSGYEEAGADGFNVKNEVANQASVPLLFDPLKEGNFPFEQSTTTEVEYKIIPTPTAFNPNQPFSNENFPCADPQGLRWTNQYDTKELSR